MCWKVSVKQVIVKGLCMKLSDFFRQLDVKLFGSYIACYIGLLLCMHLKMGMKQVIAEGLCMKLSDFFRQLDVKLFGSYIALYIMCVNLCGGEFETVNR